MLNAAALFLLFATQTAPSSEFVVLQNGDKTLTTQTAKAFDQKLSSRLFNVKVRASSSTSTCDLNQLACLKISAQVLPGKHTRWVVRPSILSIAGKTYIEVVIVNSFGAARSRIEVLSSPSARADALVRIVEALSQSASQKRVLMMPLINALEDEVLKAGYENSVKQAVAQYPAIFLVEEDEAAIHIEAAKSLSADCAQNLLTPKCRKLLSELAASDGVLQMSLKHFNGSDAVEALYFDRLTLEESSVTQAIAPGAVDKSLGDLFVEEGRTGALKVIEKQKGLVYIDGILVGQTPSNIPIAGIELGKHNLRVALNAGSSWELDVFVKKSTVTPIREPLARTKIIEPINSGALVEEPFSENTPISPTPASEREGVFVADVTFIGQWSPGEEHTLRQNYFQRLEKALDDQVISYSDMSARHPELADCRKQECALQAAHLFGSKRYIITEAAKVGNMVEISTRSFDLLDRNSNVSVSLRTQADLDNAFWKKWQTKAKPLSLKRQGPPLLGSVLFASSVAVLALGLALAVVGFGTLDQEENPGLYWTLGIGGAGASALGALGVGTGLGIILSE